MLIHTLPLGKRQSLPPSRCPAAHNLNVVDGDKVSFDLTQHKVYKWLQFPAPPSSSILTRRVWLEHGAGSLCSLNPPRAGLADKDTFMLWLLLALL